jgi:hypothetical protein
MKIYQLSQYSLRHSITNHCDRCITHLLLLELEDIINNWNICFRIIITLIKESKNKSCFIFKKKSLSHINDITCYKTRVKPTNNVHFTNLFLLSITELSQTYKPCNMSVFLCQNFGIFAHILDLLYRYLWVNITFEFYFS